MAVEPEYVSLQCQDYYQVLVEREASNPRWEYVTKWTLETMELETEVLTPNNLDKAYRTTTKFTFIIDNVRAKDVKNSEYEILDEESGRWKFEKLREDSRAEILVLKELMPFRKIDGEILSEVTASPHIKNYLIQVDGDFIKWSPAQYATWYVVYIKKEGGVFEKFEGSSPFPVPEHFKEKGKKIIVEVSAHNNNLKDGTKYNQASYKYPEDIMPIVIESSSYQEVVLKYTLTSGINYVVWSTTPNIKSGTQVPVSNSDRYTFEKTQFDQTFYFWFKAIQGESVGVSPPVSTTIESIQNPTLSDKNPTSVKINFQKYDGFSSSLISKNLSLTTKTDVTGLTEYVVSNIMPGQTVYFAIEYTRGSYTVQTSFVEFTSQNIEGPVVKSVSATFNKQKEVSVKLDWTGKNTFVTGYLSCSIEIMRSNGQISSYPTSGTSLEIKNIEDGKSYSARLAYQFSTTRIYSSWVGFSVPLIDVPEEPEPEIDDYTPPSSAEKPVLISQRKENLGNSYGEFWIVYATFSLDGKNVEMTKHSTAIQVEVYENKTDDTYKAVASQLGIGGVFDVSSMETSGILERNKRYYARSVYMVGSAKVYSDWLEFQTIS